MRDVDCWYDRKGLFRLKVKTLCVFFFNHHQLVSDSLKNLIDHVLDVLFLYLKLVQYLLLELIVIFFQYDQLLFSPKRRNLALLGAFKSIKIEIFGQIGFAVDSDNGGTDLLVVFAESPGSLGWGFFDVTVVEVFFGDVVEGVNAGAVSGGEYLGVGEFFLFAGPVFA